MLRQTLAKIFYFGKLKKILKNFDPAYDKLHHQIITEIQSLMAGLLDENSTTTTSNNFKQNLALYIKEFVNSLIRTDKKTMHSWQHLFIPVFRQLRELSKQ